MKLKTKKMLKTRLLSGLLSVAMVFSNAASLTAFAEGQTAVLPEVQTPATVDSKTDVWDFGAAQLDENVYNNRLTADVINSWYAAEGGTKGLNIATFTVLDGENVAFAFEDGGYATTHRLRSKNTAITRYDDKALKNAEGAEEYQGYIYSNKGSNADVKVKIALQAGDIVTLAAASNGNPSEIVFTAPDGTTQSYTHDKGGSTASTHTFYAKETGLYSFHSANEKLVVARIYVRHTQPVNVVGFVNAPAGMSDLAITFTNRATGEAVNAPVSNGAYAAVLNEQYTYDVSLSNANGYIIIGAQELSVTPELGGENHYTQFDVNMASVALADVQGTISGISDADLAKMKFSFDSEAVYVPEIIRNGNTYTTKVEKGNSYTVKVIDADDYNLVSATTLSTDENTTFDIVFSAKPVYKVTINPTGVELANLATAKFTFTRHSDEDVTVEEAYQYQFVGTENIALRDGVYTVSVTDCEGYAQNITSNLKVEGADVTKTIGFKSTNTPIVEEVDTTKDVVLTVGATGCDYTTINAALAAVKNMNRGADQKAIISIKPGNYEEMLVIDTPNVVLKNASAAPSINTKNKGVDIDANAVRITSYYGHGYTYFSMNNQHKYDADLLAVNKENGYASYENKGAGTTDDSYWNATVIVKANGFQAENIIFENSFNQYISAKAADDIIVKQSGAKEGTVARASMAVGDTSVQDKKYVERAAALAIANNVSKVSFDGCKFIGRQDTLYGGTGVSAAFYGCKIYGGTDFIFGGMTAVFAKCDLVMNTMEDGNDVSYITAAQQKDGRGYLMYNCNITSTTPGVDTASEKVSKPGYFGRPWQAGTSEVVYYATIIGQASDKGSLIAAEGWNSSLGGTSDNVYEFGTYEMVAGIDNLSKRASWANPAATAVEGAKLKNGSDVSVATFLGDWDAFAGKDMTIVYPTTKIEVEEEAPGNVETKEYSFDVTTLTAAKDKEAINDGDELAENIVNKGTGTVKRISTSTGAVTSIEVAKAAASGVEFEVKGTADAEIVMSSTGGNNKSAVALLGPDGNVVANNENITIVSGTGKTTLTYTALSAGVYKIVSPLDADNNRGARLYTVKLEDTVTVAPVTEEFVFDVTTLTAAADKEAINDGDELTSYFVNKGKGSVKRISTSTGKVTSMEVAKAAASWVEFTVVGTATEVEIVMSSTGGSNESAVALLGADGNAVANEEGIAVVSGTSKTTMHYANLPAGTYRIVSPADESRARGARLYSIKVTQVSSGTPVDTKKPWNQVADPVITGVTVSGNDVTVAYDMVIDKNNGADKVVVDMLDAEGNVLDSIPSTEKGNSGQLVFKPAGSGRYFFRVTAVRKNETDKVSAVSEGTDFSLPLTAPNVKSATSKGNGKVEVEWDAVKEATGYIVTLNGENVATTETELITLLSGLTVGTKYTFGVIAVRGEEKSAAGTIEATVSASAQRTWQFSAYGDGVDSSKCKYTGNINEGSVKIFAEGGKGKLVPGSTDGLSFYYTAIDPKTENFTLTANIHVDSWTYSNGQEGFGLMAADTVGLNGDNSIFWNNTIQLLSSKVEYYWNGTEVTNDTSASKVTMKLGIGGLQKGGVTKSDVAAIKAGTTKTPANYFTKDPAADTLEVEGAKSGVRNLIGNCTTADMGGEYTDLKLQMQRNNDGYVIRWLSMDGEVLGEKLYYDQERTALTLLDEDNIYVGFFAARNARITVSDVELTTIKPEDDVAAGEHEIEMITSSAVMESANFDNSAEHTLVFVANMDGQITITAAGETVASGKVTANEKFNKAVTLLPGDNEYQVTFDPDDDFVPGQYQQMTSLETVSFTHVVKYTCSSRTNLYVSPSGVKTAVGSKEDPMDIYTAVKMVKPGSKIILLSGTYLLSSTVKVERGIDGTAANRIYMIADPEGTSRPVLNFCGRCAGMILAGDYWYFEGFDVTGSADGQKGIQVSGNNNILNNLETYKNGNTGIQISRYKTTDSDITTWPANNLILNCTSYLNADKGYEDADGFAAKLTVGEGNVFDGCVAMYNADDGWDLYAKVQTGSIGAVTIQNCIAFKNGYVKRLDNGAGALDMSGVQVNAGNGNGFKMGGDGLAGAHVLKNSIAFDNKAKGIDSNSCPDIKVYDSIAYNNESYNVAFYTKNNVNTAFLANDVISFKDSKGNKVADNYEPLGSQVASDVINETFYTYNGSYSANTAGTKVEATWFKSLDTASVYSTGVKRTEENIIDLGDLFARSEEMPATIATDMTIATLKESTEAALKELDLAYNAAADDNANPGTGSGETPVQPENPVQPQTPSVEKPSVETITVPVTYIVARGDTMSKIAKRNNMTLAELLALNPQIKNPNKIYVGEVIFIGYTQKAADEKNVVDREYVYYVVRKGDSLAKIARKHNITLAKLIGMNPGLAKQKYIFVGQKVRIQ